MILMAKSFGKNASKYGTRHKSCSPKHAVKFEQKCWQNRAALCLPLLYAGAFAYCANWLVKLAALLLFPITGMQPIGEI